MPRTYKRKLGSRRYSDYTTEQLELCLQAIKSGQMSQRRASEHYNIPRRTLVYKLKKVHMGMPGPPPTFTNEEEVAIATHIETMSIYGFPLTEYDLKITIKTYLDKCGRTIKKFKNNLPGREWVKQFLKRHQHLTVRLATNIKRSRAALSKDILEEYITNLKPVLENVPPSHIFNYDETNLTDDPGQQKVIVRRGCKYPEKICNSSKASTSIMFCGSAAGELMPPYVVYKSIKLWNTWTENGPKGCHYSNSPSGWFDTQIFSDWLETLMIPKLKKMEGKKVLIGDNLASHLSIHVLKLCRENNIAFVCLPPNSSHITQPLDVAFFRPLKIEWRKILTDWKASAEGSKNATVPKQTFPTLLKTLLENIEPNIGENLKSGFRKCGIAPCDVSELLKRIPGEGESVNNEAMSSSFIDILEKKRKSITDLAPKGRKKKFEIPAGKSICHELNLDSDEETPTTSRIVNDRDSDHYSVQDESDDNGGFLEPDSAEESIAEPERLSCFKTLQREKNAFVVVKYDNGLYPGMIIDFDDKGATVDAMCRSLKSWKWPQTKDVNFYEWDDILGSIEPPKKISKRGFFSVKELDDFY